MRYWATFKGTLKGALGIRYFHSRMCEGATPEAAQVSLYTTHEHISDLKLCYVGDGSRAKAGDTLEPLTDSEKPTGITFLVIGPPTDTTIPVRNTLGSKLTLPKADLYIYREIGGTATS